MDLNGGLYSKTPGLYSKTQLMFRNYLLITLRNFKRQKLFSLLNIFGLALGLASAILIFLYVSDELRYDTMQPYYKDTYRIGSIFINPDGQRFENTVAPGFITRYLNSLTIAVKYFMPAASTISATPLRSTINRPTRSYSPKRSSGPNLGLISCFISTC